MATSRPNLTFSSASEIKSYVQAQVGGPQQSHNQTRFSAKLVDLNGEAKQPPLSLPVAVGLTLPFLLLNPIKYDGSLLRDV